MTTAPLRPVLGVLSGPSRAEQVKPGLVAEIDRIRTLLRRLVEGEQPADLPPGEVATLDHIANRLGLTPFERDVLLLAVAAELDGEVAALVGTVQGGDSRPTFALAMTLLADPHWDAVSPGRPLRRWRLLEPVQGGPLPSRPLVVDEYAVHTVTGLAADGLLGRWEAARSGGPPEGWLTASQQAVADEVVAAVAALDGPVLVRLDGSDPDACAAVAERVAEGLGLVALVVRDAALSDADVVTTAAVLDREAVLHDRLLVTADARLLPLLESRIVLVTRGPGEPDARQEPVSGRTVVARSVHLPTAAEQATLWRRALGRVRAPVSAAASDIAHHYRLSARSVAAIAGEWRALPDRDVDALRRLTRERARVGLGPLAERIEPRSTWDDLVLPPGQQMLLHDLARQVRHRSTVYDDWGFAEKSARGLGITALFSGESGTGKTMAAEVIAGDLGLDLYRIDLSAVVSKYIGETEKNLRTVFDAAEAGGAVLLFDEADALFGKRSDVKDSHDRYANLEVAYLLQRMESYRGLAILTTNLRANVDRAFLRRLRFVVQFPFPDEQSRAEIWRRTFPPGAPVDGLDVRALARLQASGGMIRAIALSAAFAAADQGVAVGPEQVLHAAKVEYAKAERMLTDAEVAAATGRPR